jgi:hypothetical protein
MGYEYRKNQIAHPQGLLIGQLTSCTSRNNPPGV